MNLNRKMEVVSKQYDEIGELYMNIQKSTGRVFPSKIWARSTLHRFVGSLKNKVVLDAGCGNGHDAVDYLNAGASYVLGFDPSQVMLDDAEEMMKNANVSRATFKIGTYEAIPFDDKCADIVIGLFSLHYVADLNAAFNEMARVTRPGGTIALVCNHPTNVNAHKKSPYRGQEVVDIKIYGGAVTVRQVSHDISEYLCPVFFQHFRLNHFEEFFPADDNGNAQRVPTDFAICATRL